MNLRHILLEVYSLLSLATSVDSWLRYTLNKLDTSPNGIYTVSNPRAGYLTTALRFLNCIDLLDSVSNFFLYVCMYVCLCVFMYV